MKPEPPGTDSPRAGPGEASPVEPPPADLPEDHVPETGAAEETGAGGKTEAPKTMPVEGDASVLENMTVFTPRDMCPRRVAQCKHLLVVQI